MGGDRSGPPAAAADEAARSVAGWGLIDRAVTAAERDGLAAALRGRFGDGALHPAEPADWRSARVGEPRIAPPDALAHLCSSDARSRLLHAKGRSLPDLVAAFHGRWEPLPDVVARPRDADEVAAVLEWCEQVGAACVPFGGGTSVVGGVRPPDDGRPTVTLQLRRMDRLRDLDRDSMLAHLDAGLTGPALEERLRPEGLTLRFFPQSFELSTLGGWVATRAGGHFATGPTRIDHLVAAIDAETPRGRWASRPLPGSGAGPSPDAALLGSEGTLGVVTGARVRVRPRPRWRAQASVTFPTLDAGLPAVRDLARSGLQPAGCRLLDPTEALLNGAGDGARAVLLLAVESAERPVADDLGEAIGIAAAHGGRCPDGPVVRDDADDRDATSAAYRSGFLRAPYLRDGLLAVGAISETFETAACWSQLPELLGRVDDALTRTVAEACGEAITSVRITHAYPDGAAPYWTVIAPARRGAEAEQWWEVKQAVSEAIAAAGGTITHHHAVGRDHVPWYAAQRPEPFAAAAAAAKRALDPAGVLNPGVLGLG